MRWKISLLAAYARTEDAARARAAGFQLHLAKPVELGVLAQAVASVRRRAQESGTG